MSLQRMNKAIQFSLGTAVHKKNSRKLSVN